jgi:hypothetical protein
MVQLHLSLCTNVTIGSTMMKITLYGRFILYTVCILCIDHVAVGMSEVNDSCFEVREANSF